MDFESRVTQQPEFKYDGKSGGPAWCKKVKNYLCGRNEHVEALLTFAEKRGLTEITNAEVASWATPACDTVTLSRRVWTFLGLCVSGDADEAYNLCPSGNGLDVWRALQHVVFRGSEMRRMNLENRVRDPKTARDLGQIRSCVQSWETDYKEFKDLGGTPLSERDRKTYLLKILPAGLRENLILNTGQYDQYVDFKHFVLNRSDEMVHLRGGPGSTGAHVADVVDMVEDDEALAAQRGGRPLRGAPKKAGAPQRTTQRTGAGVQDYCINCGSKTHQTRNCTRDNIPKERRPCFQCGKPGHMARDCTEKSARSLEDEGVAAMCTALEDDEGFIPVPAAHAARRPRAIKIEDFVKPKNRFMTLSSTCESPCCNQDAQSMGEMTGKERRAKLIAATSTPISTSTSTSIASSTSTRSIINAPNSKVSNDGPRNDVDGNPFVGRWESDMDDISKMEDLRAELQSKYAAKFGSDLHEDVAQQLAEERRGHQEKGINERDLDRVFEGMANGEYDPAATAAFYGIFSGILESEDMDMECHTADTEWEEIEVCVAADSGCGDHVMSKEHCPGYLVQPSVASKAGKGFIAAGGNKIANEGEACLNLRSGQQKMTSTFQIARVTRPLMSVGKICDAGHEVLFTRTHAIVRNLQGREICRFARKGGLYLLNFKLRSPKDAAKPTGFGGQGQKR